MEVETNQHDSTACGGGGHFCFLRFTPFTPSRWISFLVLTFSSTVRAVRRVPVTGYRDNQLLSFIHSKQWKQFVPRKCSNNRNMYANTTTAKMKHNGIHLARWNSHSGVDGGSGLLVHDAALTDSYRRFGKASCLHLRHLVSPKRTPDHSKWCHMADYLNLQKTPSAPSFLSRRENNLSEIRIPITVKPAYIRNARGFSVSGGFRFIYVLKIGSLGLQGFSATDRFPLCPRSE